MSTPTKTDGLLLIGHGTREPVGVAEMLATAERVADLLSQLAVEPGFLELAQPTIEQGFERLAQSGVRRMCAMPLLLFAAGHAKQDIPAELRRLAARHPQIAVTQAEPLGCHPAIVELSAQRYAEALAGRPPVPAAQTLLLMVGRGSRDAEATEHMHQFAALRGRSPRIEVAFAAMAMPLLDDALEGIAGKAGRGRDPSSDLRRVVVQPHLLFDGQLLSDIRSKVARRAELSDELEWVVTEHLGPSELLAAAIVARVRPRGDKFTIDPNV